MSRSRLWSLSIPGPLRFRSLQTSLALLAIATSTSSTLVGCKDKAADNADGAATAASAAPVSAAESTGNPTSATAASADDHGARGMHEGPSAAFFQAARTLDLKDDQKAKLDAAEKAAHANAAVGAKDAAKDLHADLILGIKAGKIDPAKLEPRYAAFDKIATTEHDNEDVALNALHAALDPAQRKAVVTSVRARQAKLEDRRAPGRDRAERKEKGDGASDGGKEHANPRVDQLVSGLDLDAEQQKKVDALAPKNDVKSMRPSPEETKKRMEVLLSAFESDTFDAKKIDTFDAKKSRAALEDETTSLAQIVLILKPEQREKLAAKMANGPSPHGGHGGFGHRTPNGANDEGPN